MTMDSYGFLKRFLWLPVAALGVPWANASLLYSFSTVTLLNFRSHRSTILKVGLAVFELMVFLLGICYFLYSVERFFPASCGPIPTSLGHGDGMLLGTGPAPSHSSIYPYKKVGVRCVKI